MRKVIPSVFSTESKDYVERFNKISKISKRMHLDVMDGEFVGYKSPSLSVIKNKDSFIDVHLMVENPVKYIKEMKKLKAKNVFIHVEINNIIENIIEIKKNGFNVGIAINPETKINDISKYIQFADLFLVMAVHPGREGQKFISNTVEKVKLLRKITDKEIFIDGGINTETSRKFKGVNVGFVSGSFIYNSENPKKEIKLLSKIK